jgi:hypothetical protein
LTISGSEIDVLPDLLYTGAFQHIDILMIEYHYRGEFTHQQKRKMELLEMVFTYLREILPKINVVVLDDESYSMANPPLPNC